MMTNLVLDWLEHGEGMSLVLSVTHAGLSLTVTVVGSKPHFNSHSGIFTNDAWKSVCPGL
jgi:hypothetical protein